MTTNNLNALSNLILATPIRHGRKARLIAISGIDGSGKRYAA